MGICRLEVIVVLIGLEFDLIESHVDDRERKATGESPPIKLGGREFLDLYASRYIKTEKKPEKKLHVKKPTTLPKILCKNQFDLRFT